MTCLTTTSQHNQNINLWNLISAINDSCQIGNKKVNVEYITVYFSKKLLRCYSDTYDMNLIRFTQTLPKQKCRGFSFQISMCIRIDDEGTVTAKIFENGSIQTTGVKDVAYVDAYIIPFVSKMIDKYQVMPYELKTKEVTVYEYSPRAKKCIENTKCKLTLNFHQGIALTGTLDDDEYYLIPQNVITKKYITKEEQIYYIQEHSTKPIVQYKTTFYRQGFSDFLVFNESAIICGIQKVPMKNHKFKTKKWTELTTASLILLENIPFELEEVMDKQLIMHQKLLEAIQEARTPTIQTMKSYKWSFSNYYKPFEYNGYRTQHILTNYYVDGIEFKRSSKDSMNWINTNKPLDAFAYPMRKSIAIKIAANNVFPNVSAHVCIIYFEASKRCALMVVHDTKSYKLYPNGGMINIDNFQDLISQLSL